METDTDDYLRSRILSKETLSEARSFFDDILTMGIDFKLTHNVRSKAIEPVDSALSTQDLPRNGEDLDSLLERFKEEVLPYCTNFASPTFMGFPDAGNSIGALGGALIQEFLQQNLINQSFCSPSGTLIEISVIRWLRETVGYTSNDATDIWAVGGILTPGGTVSNTIGMMLARENKAPGTLESGVTDASGMRLIVPKGIGHYSVKSAQMWIGCGAHLVEVETDNYRYNLEALKQALIENKGKTMALVAYAGDSRTMTVDNLDAVADLAKKVDPEIWLHADACHGFSLGFSASLRQKIKGIEKFDSISADPHKVMLAPYTVSALLVRNPDSMKLITSKSDLIMQEPFAFGQVTPFVGSKPWLSLKLWFMMRHFGKEGLDNLITRRHEFAQLFAEKLRANKNFAVLNEVDINSVAFFYTGGDLATVSDINAINRSIHARIQHEGLYQLHQFSIPDNGLFEAGQVVYPLRFMSGNPLATERELDSLIEYLLSIGAELRKHE